MLRRKNTTGPNSPAPILATGLILLLFVAVAVLIVAVGLQWLRGRLAVPGIFPGLTGRNTGQKSENIDYEFGQLLPVWTGTDRITVLLMGVDERSQENGPWRTDTLMLLTLDPLTLNAGVLSIPRDLRIKLLFSMHMAECKGSTLKM